MTSDNTVSNQTGFLSANTARKSPETLTNKPEQHNWLAEDSNEWEGFYDDNDYDEF